MGVTPTGRQQPRERMMRVAAHEATRARKSTRTGTKAPGSMRLGVHAGGSGIAACRVERRLADPTPSGAAEAK
jgi:hypothetical protein